MGIKLGKLKRGSIFRKTVQVQLKEIYSEFTIDIVKFIFVFPIVFIEMFFINLLEIMEIIRALRVYTFVNNKVFPVFLMRKVVIAMRTL